MALMLSIIRDLWDVESIGLTRQVQEFLYASGDQDIDRAYKREMRLVCCLIMWAVEQAF